MEFDDTHPYLTTQIITCTRTFGAKSDVFVLFAIFETYTFMFAFSSGLWRCQWLQVVYYMTKKIGTPRLS